MKKLILVLLVVTLAACGRITKTTTLGASQPTGTCIITYKNGATLVSCPDEGGTVVVKAQGDIVIMPN